MDGKATLIKKFPLLGASLFSVVPCSRVDILEFEPQHSY